jgi:hypothetical protein
MNFRMHKNVQSFLSSWATVSVPRRTELSGVLSRWQKVCTRTFRQANVTASSDNSHHRLQTEPQIEGRGRTVAVKGPNTQKGVTQWHKWAPMTQIFCIPVRLESAAIQWFAIQPDERNTNIGPTLEMTKPYVPSKHSSHQMAALFKKYSDQIYLLISVCYLSPMEAHGSVVDWDTILQAGRLQVDSRWGHWIFQST